MHCFRSFFTGAAARDEMLSQAGDGNDKEKYPTGEFVYKKRSRWGRFTVRTRLLFSLPCESFKRGSVLKVLLRGKISDQLRGVSRPHSLPRICENFEKAAYDPRVAGIYLHIDALGCGWGKLDEIRRHVLDFKKSGKFVVGYMPVCGPEEYYIGCACDDLYAPPSAWLLLYGFLVRASFVAGALEKVGIEPQVEMIGKYKSYGEYTTRKSMSDESREVKTALLDNIYDNWLDTVSRAKEKRKEEIENFINQGEYQIEKMKEEGLITDIKYDDEVLSLLKTRMGIPSTKKLPTVEYSKYCSVRKWTLGLGGKKNRIAVIRASGSISRVQGRFKSTSSKIIAEQFIEKVRRVKESKKYKAAIIRIDSPGGGALASDLMWREIKALSDSIPVIASMSDVAASGGYYMAMAAHAIVAENLTLTGSIGVVSSKYNMGKLYESIGFNKEIISRGRYAEVYEADHRPFSADEAELFAKSAQDVYKQFRDKAASSRSMTVEDMEKVAQGRVWTGSDAASRGLVDAIGGFSRAVAIAKHKANIPQDKSVNLVEVSKTSSSLLKIVLKMASRVLETDELVTELIDEMACDGDEIQARMDGILFQKFDGNSIWALIKDTLRHL